MLTKSYKKFLLTSLTAMVMSSSLVFCNVEPAATTTPAPAATAVETTLGNPWITCVKSALSNKYVKYPALSVIAYSLYQFYSRKPKSLKEEPNRVNWEQIKPLICNPLNLVRELSTNFTATVTKLHNAYLDLVVGHPGQSSTLKADKDGSISPKEGVESRGLMGNAHDKIKPLQSTAFALAGIIVLWDNDGFKAMLKKFGFDNDFTEKILPLLLLANAVSEKQAQK